MTKLERQAFDVQDRLNVTQNNIFRGNEKMDAFKLQMNWNQEEIEQWALAAKQKEEDNLALQKYARADEVKIKEMNLKLEKLTKAAAAKQMELDNEITETQTAQIELDKTAEDFRHLHGERQDLVAQWEQAIDTMKRRDEAINETGEVLICLCALMCAIRGVMSAGMCDACTACMHPRHVLIMFIRLWF